MSALMNTPGPCFVPGLPGAVKNLDGTGGVYPLYYDVHTGGIYYYRNKGFGAVRVYVKPGESVDWIEAADPFLTKLKLAA